MGLNTAGTFSILLWLATSAAVFAQAPPDAQRRLLCAQLGGDLTDPGEMAAFKRCLANAPAPASPPKPAPYTAPAPFERPAVPLAAGVNKGNVDNTGGPRYLYFIAGPGHVDVKMAFKEMGVMGAPLRQTLNFDMFDEQGHLISHNALSSLDQLERLSIPGNFVNKMKTTMVISAPAGLVRLGGYYEVEVDGAVQFDPSAPSTADVKPENTDLVHPVGPLTTPVGPLTKPVGPLTKPVGPLYASVGPLYTPGQALTMNETQHEVRLSLEADVLFDFDKATIRPQAADTLHHVAGIIRDKNHGTVRIEGYTDSKGAADYNLRLSDARAVAVKAWLVDTEKLPPTGLVTQGFGAAKPVAHNTKPDGSDDPAGRQLNRRVELVLAK
jgi:outer membrane protein OmpA-like peptidoglycan-associated protein